MRWPYLNDKNMIVFLSIMLIVVIALFVTLYIRISMRIKKQDYRFTTTKKKSYLYSFYKLISKLRITKRYVKKIRKRYEIYETKDEKELGKKVAFIVIRSWIISVVIIIIAFFINRSLEMFMTAITVVYLANALLINSAVEKAIIKFLVVFAAYIDNMSHYYYKYNTIEDALYQSSIDAKEPVKAHVERIFNILTSENIEEEINRYRAVIPNRHVKQFLSLCEKLSINGDRKVDGESLFVTNLTQLKKEINSEINDRNKIISRFRSLSLLTITPMFFLTTMKNWAISNVPTLKDYYSSIYGIGLFILIYLATIFIFNMLSILKFQGELEVKKHPYLKKILKIKCFDLITTNYTMRNYGLTLRTQKLIRKAAETITVKEFVLKQIICSLVTVMICISVSLTAHHNKRENLVNYVDNLTSASTSASDKQIEEIKDAVKAYTNKYKGREVRIEDVEGDLIAEGIIKNKMIMTITAEEVTSRVNAYNREYFKWYELLISIIVGTISFYSPYIFLQIRKRLIEMHMQDEVIQFQALIYMLMHFERTSVEEILTSMEDYAVAFKTSISECLNDFSSGEIDALVELKEKESYEPFRKLVDNLIMCDSIEMKKAFGEVLVDRKIYQDKREVQNEIIINQKTVIGTAISWIPFALSIVFYLILPFLTESMNEFVNYANQIQNM